jgi:hypothetical protein
VVFRPIETDAETVERVVKAVCCLHNYILRNNTNIAATEIEEHDEPLCASSDTSSTNPRSNMLPSKCVDILFLTLTGEYYVLEIQTNNFCTHA